MARNYAECPCYGCPEENDCFYRFDHCVEDCEEWFEWYYGTPKLKNKCCNCEYYVNKKCQKNYEPDIDVDCYYFEQKDLQRGEE